MQTPEDGPPVVGMQAELESRLSAAPTSECAEQNGSHEREHRTHCQHVEPQGNVHGTPPCFELGKF